MNLRGIANAATSTVNPNTIVTLQPSTGYTVGAGAKQIPSYGDPVTGPAQIQAMSKDDLKLIENMNIQGVALKIYLRGNLYGVIRPQSKGGDLVTIAAPAPAPWIGTWLITKVLENWADWTSAVMVKQ